MGHTRLYRSNAERRRAFTAWLRFYDHRRPHTALDGLTPMAALVNNVHGNHNERREQPLHPDRAFVGSEQVRSNWAEVFAGVPDFQAELLRSTDQVDTGWAEWHWHGTRTDGTRLDMREVTIFGVRDDRIDWGRLYFEDVEVVGQGIDQAVTTWPAEPSKAARLPSGSHMNAAVWSECGPPHLPHPAPQHVTAAQGSWPSRRHGAAHGVARWAY